jgi:uncharacterized protein YbjT (DUF2867 family)
MKYVITGSAGHISKPLTMLLLAAGHEVTVIGRNAEHLKELTSKGAKAAIGSIEDLDFLKQAFAGADAIYTMVPPTFNVTDWKAHIGQVGKNYADAIQANNIKYVVNLSSYGAHRPDGCGPVSGLYRAENALNTLTDVNIKHLRPGYFFNNFLGNIDMVKHMNIIGSNFGGNDFKLVLADPNDIAAAAAEELLKLDFKGRSVRYITSDERSTTDIAAILGKAVNKPDLPWITFTNEQALAGLQQAGLPEEIAMNYAEMGAGLQSGIMSEDYWKNRPTTFGKTKLEDFAQTFAAVYNKS